MSERRDVNPDDETVAVPGILGPGGDAGAPDEDAMVTPMWELLKRLPAYVRLAAGLVRDPEVPPAAKACLVAGGVYLASPIDLIPGIIPVAGQIDDLYMVLTGLQQATRFCPPAVVDAHFAAAGLKPGIVDDDLAAIREVVRRGLMWTLRCGGALIKRGSRRATSLARRAGQRGAMINDNDSYRPRPASARRESRPWRRGA